MNMRTYEAIEKWTENRLCFELASDSCILQSGDKYIQTFNGRPLITFYRDKPSVVSVANPGLRWMNLVGNRLGIIRTKAIKHQHAEPCRRIYFSGISFLDTKQNLEVETDANGKVTNMSVPKEDVPRTYTIDKQRWSEYLTKVEDLCAVSTAKARLLDKTGSRWASCNLHELLNIDQQTVDRFMGYESHLKAVIKRHSFHIQHALNMITFEV